MVGENTGGIKFFYTGFQGNKGNVTFSHRILWGPAPLKSWGLAGQRFHQYIIGVQWWIEDFIKEGPFVQMSYDMV